MAKRRHILAHVQREITELLDQADHELDEELDQTEAHLADLTRQLAEATARADALTTIAADLHWMARRYCAGRSSYAPGMFNDHTRALLVMGVELNNCDGTLFAHDGMGRSFDRLSDADAAASITASGDVWSREPEIVAARERAEKAERERDAMRRRAEAAESDWQAAEMKLAEGQKQNATRKEAT